jgi:manganese/zinc/iron transport system substrate-binding protein
MMKRQARCAVLAMALTVLAGAVALLGTGCGQSGAREREDGRWRVVATTTIVADTVARVGGDRVRVHSLMGPGVDPHLYKASEGDVLRIAQADIVFYSGLHLEARMSEVLEKVGRRVRTVAVTRDIPRDRLLSAGAESTMPDPHVWFDVSLWRQTVPAICNALCELDPASSATYQRNAAQYARELEELDAYVRQQAQTVPKRQRVLITAHDAFRYFGRAYDFEVVGLQGISTASEAGTRDIDNLAKLILDRKVRAIFVESSVPARTVQAVQQAVRARGFDVRIGGQLFSDALGTPGTPAGTYVGMVRYNIDTIVEALKP